MALTLSPADPSLAEWWYEDRQDAAMRQFNPLAPATVESLRERLARASSDFAEFEHATSFFWAVKSGDKLVGHVTLHDINRTMLTAEIGYGVSHHARGRGLATESVRWLASSAFAHTPLRKLIAFVHEGNAASRRVLQRAGFRQEGLLREHFLVNGAPANQAIYGLLRGDLGERQL
jgi:ribosomal-protein-alanine N-acetyltransferase